MSPRAGLWLALLVPLSAAADPASEETLLACRRIDAASERLACYDRVVDRVSAEITPGSPAGVPRASSSGAGDDEKLPLRERLFGRPSAESAQALRKSYGAEAVDALSAKVASARAGADRLLVITLDNGQVWRQVDTATFLLRSGDAVEIESGALGAFYLRRNDRGRTIRVKRLH